jgi:hypothetical protein
VWKLPALIWMSVPEGAVPSPKLLPPQQATVPSVFTPQAWDNPALTWVNFPAGGVLWPLSFFPQHATDSSVLTPQV